MRRVVTAVMAAVVLTAAGCNRQPARERQRAERLERALARLATDTAARRLPDWPEARTGRMPRLVPEWGELRVALVECGNDLADVTRRIAARDIPGLVGSALDGWRRSSALDARGYARMTEILDHNRTLKDVYASLDSMDAFRVQESVSRTAIYYAHDFLRTLHLLAELGPPSRRAAVFEQLAEERGRTTSEGLAAAVGDVLRDVWAKEDDRGLKARMGQRLVALKLPLAPPPAAPVAAGAGSSPGPRSTRR